MYNNCFLLQKLTLADIAIAFYVGRMKDDEIGPANLEKVPGLVGIINATLANPGIKEWIENRPDTQF